MYELNDKLWPVLRPMEGSLALAGWFYLEEPEKSQVSAFRQVGARVGKETWVVACKADSRVSGRTITLN